MRRMLLGLIFLAAPAFAGFQMVLPTNLPSQKTKQLLDQEAQTENTIIIDQETPPEKMQMPATDAPITPLTRYVFTALSGQYKNNELILENVPAVIRFNQPPKETAQALLPYQLVSNWNTWIISNTHNAIQGTLDIYSRTGATRYFLRITNAAVKNNTLHFKATSLQATPPQTFELATLFINTEITTESSLSAFDTKDMTSTYALTSQYGQYSHGKLTLFQIPRIQSFTKLSSTHFAVIELSKKLKGKLPLKTTLTLYNAKGAVNVDVVLSTITVDKNTVSCDVTVTRGEIPSSFKLSTLFLRPVSDTAY